MTDIINAGFPAGVFHQPQQEKRGDNGSSDLGMGGEDRTCLQGDCFQWQLAVTPLVLGINPFPFDCIPGWAPQRCCACGGGHIAWPPPAAVLSLF